MAKSGMSENDSEGSGGKDNSNTNAIPPPPPTPALKKNRKALQNNVAAHEHEDIPSDDDVENNAVANPIIQTSTPISIVIQSLVQNLCYNYEQDDKKANATYKMICDMLYDMMIIDKSYMMQELEGIRNQYRRAFRQLLTSSPRGDGQRIMRPVWSNDISNEWSHYKREFDEIAYIAGGGFGKVFQVRHKLDDNEYAVKKIFIRSNSIEAVRNYLSEVKTFASLNHSNIVQYKAAWLELGASTSEHTLEEHSSDEEFVETSDIRTRRTTATSVTEDITDNSVITDMYRDLDLENDNQQGSSSDFDICFEHTSNFSLTHMTTTTKEKRIKRNSTSEGGNAICKVEDIRRLQGKQQNNPKWATLFIQMSLCHSTLKQWLEKRNQADSSTHNALVPVNNTLRFNTVIEILRQLLIGIEYIHSKSIVHHDIKPSNIFMQLENNALLVQLGDFGLACPLQSSKHSLACGTKLYAAPEQLARKCDPKSDMYSLGIVVFELTETFSTDMERAKSISSLRKGNMPESTRKAQPKLAEIISQLVVEKSAARPDATTLLKFIDATDEEGTASVQKLKTKVAEQDVQLAEKDQEILRLKEELLKMKFAPFNA